MIQEVVYLWEKLPFLTGSQQVHISIWCVGLKLAEGGGNKHQNSYEQELISEWRTQCSAQQLVNKRIV